MNKIAFSIFLFILLFFWIPSLAIGTVITSDTVWEGKVFISEDILIPEGVTLIIKPGSTIKITPSESTRTDPEYMSALTEITVRGVLKAEGTEELPIEFILTITKGDESSVWGGLIVDGGTIHLKSCRIQNAETGIYIIKGVLDIKDSFIRDNRYGIVAQGEGTNVSIRNTLIKDNDHGIFSLRGARIDSNNSIIKDNRKRDLYSYKGKDYPLVKEYNPPTPPFSKVIPPRPSLVKEEMGDLKIGTEGFSDVSVQYSDEVLLRDTMWQGRIEIDGIIRVPEGGRLIVMPGTIVEFKRKDTNGDGIGENGLLIQGVLIAKGTKENPIVFRSAGKNRKMGDWDSINIMNSDGAQNLIEYCQIEDAYRGLHFHFSNVAVKESVFKNNYRGIQFQESVAEIKGNYLYENKSGIQARDSEIVCVDNYVFNNYYGANFFRVTLMAKGNKILNNLGEGLRIREGEPSVEENLIDSNRFGLLITDSFYGGFNRNVIANNLESGMSLKGADNVEINGNFIQGNGFHGISIQDARATIRRNNISGNGERAIKMVSFDGIISENNFIKNGIYAIGLDGKEAIHDRGDDSQGEALKYEEIRKSPIIYSWPMESIITDVVWYGDINIKSDVTVSPGATLVIAPGARVLFSKGVGLKINGRIIAKGEKIERITFTSMEKNVAGDWNEIFLEHANDSIFSNCDFKYATWGIHNHFTNLTVEKCLFSNNYGGLRFRSGPLKVKHSIFENNSIGLRAYRGSATIIENIITGNDIGIFVREKGGELTIKNNNIFANSEYNIRSGDFNDEDINAMENWWGDGDPVDKIFDGRKEPGIGRVLYEPYQKEPFKIDSIGIK